MATYMDDMGPCIEYMGTYMDYMDTYMDFMIIQKIYCMRPQVNNIKFVYALFIM